LRLEGCWCTWRGERKKVNHFLWKYKFALIQFLSIQLIHNGSSEIFLVDARSLSTEKP
jgi:hypothetical protein